MADKKLKKLRRTQLLELMIQQEKEIQSLRSQLEEAQKKLEERRTAIAEAGSIAEAALSLNRVFESAQAAADMYLEEIRERAGGKEKQT